MIRPEANPMLSNQLTVPKLESDSETRPQSVDSSSLYDHNANNQVIHNDEKYLLEQINSNDLMAYPEENSSEIYKLLNILDVPSNQNIDPPNEIPDRKVFPNVEEHDNANLKFGLLLDPIKHNGSKKKWYYSSKVNKVYICLDKPFYIDIQYLPKIQEPLFLRSMMVYIDDMGTPVKRCNNHLCNDKAENYLEKNSVVRCGNDDVTYFGSAEGKNLEDRLAVIIKLNNVLPDDNDFCKQSIQLTFVCQNSCIGRKPTALIFTLETRSQVLGKRVVNVKICSCPKRDKEKDEESLVSKRKSSVEHVSSGKRPSKVMKIKEEPISDPVEVKNNSSTGSLHLQSPYQNHVKFRNDGTVCVTMNMPSIRSASRYVQNGYDIIAGEMVSDNENAEKYSQYLRDAKRLTDMFSK